MLQLVEMDNVVSLAEQMKAGGGPVVLINKFTVAASEAELLLDAWRADAGHFKSQPGFISAQLHRGIAGSNVFINHAVWESPDDFRLAFQDPAVRQAIGGYPESAVASPHLFRKVAVPGICVG